jgi:hypothetical protein
MRIVRDVFAAGLVIALAAACRVDDRDYVETPPAEEELDVRILEQPAPVQPQPTQPGAGTAPARPVPPDTVSPGS